ncbi:hypothetical protein BCR44DRAFT_88223 [Catenaria anguillulae PL171]|uniref:Uncharacterized protein n=1 Tax=Catenaria anguillulae PL171 TaxID=765915 RepID=A0A1Y2H941_9FUNG|nr:hypothetical protein BCR44DRAFT_88223 [Catenaria anguillulae PL171]
MAVSFIELTSAEPWFAELIYWESLIFQLFALIFAVICLLCSVRYCRHGRTQWSPFHGLALAQSVIALISDVTALLTIGQQDCSTFGLASLLLSHSQATMHTFLMLARLRVFRHVIGVPDRSRFVLQWGIPIVYVIIEAATLTDACNNSTSLADFQDRRTMFTIWRVFSALVNLGAAMSMYLSLARIRRAQRYPNMSDAIEHDARMARAQWHIQWSACTIPIELVVVLVASKFPSLSSAISAALLRLLLFGQIMMLSAVNKVMAYAYLYVATAKGSSSASGNTGGSGVASKVISSPTSKLPHASTKSSGGGPNIQSLASNPILNGFNQPTNVAFQGPAHPSQPSAAPTNVNIHHAAHHIDTPGSSSNLSFSGDDVAVSTSNPAVRAGPRLLWALSTVGLSSIAKGPLPALSSGNSGAGSPPPSAPHQSPHSRVSFHPTSAAASALTDHGSSRPQSSPLASLSNSPNTASRLPLSSSHALPIVHHHPPEGTGMRHVMGPVVARHRSIPNTLTELDPAASPLHVHRDPTPTNTLPISLRSTGASLATTHAFETPPSTHSRQTCSTTDPRAIYTSMAVLSSANIHVVAPANTPSAGSVHLDTPISSAITSTAVLAVAPGGASGDVGGRDSVDNTSTKPTGSQITTGYVSFRTAPVDMSSKSLVPWYDTAGRLSWVASSWVVTGAPSSTTIGQVASSHSLHVLPSVVADENGPEREELPPSRDE